MPSTSVPSTTPVAAAQPQYFSRTRIPVQDPYLLRKWPKHLRRRAHAYRMPSRASRRVGSYVLYCCTEYPRVQDNWGFELARWIAAEAKIPLLVLACIPHEVVKHAQLVKFHEAEWIKAVPPFSDEDSDFRHRAYEWFLNPLNEPFGAGRFATEATQAAHSAAAATNSEAPGTVASGTRPRSVSPTRAAANDGEKSPLAQRSHDVVQGSGAFADDLLGWDPIAEAESPEASRLSFRSAMFSAAAWSSFLDSCHSLGVDVIALRADREELSDVLMAFMGYRIETQHGVSNLVEGVAAVADPQDERGRPVGTSPLPHMVVVDEVGYSMPW